MSVEKSTTIPPQTQRIIMPSDRLVNLLGSQNLSKSHVKARSEKGQGYPERFPVSAFVTWQMVDIVSYTPVEYTASVVLANDRSKDPSNPRLWADPEDLRKAKGAPDFLSYEGKIVLNKSGRPLNPMGPTGITGRGLLGNWGANNAVDPIVTRINDNGQIEMIAIKRKDSGEWAIPGGMIDRGERVTAALKRELGEESSAIFDFEKATPVYQGYVDDPRNTDNAWMETDAYHLHLDTGTQVALDASDDATDARWMVLTNESVQSLYASHASLVLRAIALWQIRTGQVVAQNGTVGIAQIEK